MSFNTDECTDETMLPKQPATAPESMLDAQQKTTDVTARLAEDFFALIQEFPQFSHPDQLPEAVLDIAAEQGIPLLDAYLRYRLSEEKKVTIAAEKRREAALQSVGSLSRGTVQTPPEQDAFLRAFRSAL